MKFTNLLQKRKPPFWVVGASEESFYKALHKVKKPPKWNYEVEVSVRGHKWGQMSVIDKRRLRHGDANLPASARGG